MHESYLLLSAVCVVLLSCMAEEPIIQIKAQPNTQDNDSSTYSLTSHFDNTHTLCPAWLFNCINRSPVIFQAFQAIAKSLSFIKWIFPDHHKLRLMHFRGTQGLKIILLINEDLCSLLNVLLNLAWSIICKTPTVLAGDGFDIIKVWFLFIWVQFN